MRQSNVNEFTHGTHDQNLNPATPAADLDKQGVNWRETLPLGSKAMRNLDKMPPLLPRDRQDECILVFEYYWNRLYAFKERNQLGIVPVFTGRMPRLASPTLGMAFGYNPRVQGVHMRYVRLITALTALAVLPVFGSVASACENCRLKEQGYHVGEMTIIGNGIVFSWAQIGKDDKPVAIGVTISETALTGLRDDPPPTYPKPPGWEYALTYPAEAVKKTPINHVSFDWNPQGHIPPGVYDVPHFDVHFYLMKYEDRQKITAEGDDLERCRKAPDKKYVPAGYIFAPESEEPKMGGHWVDTQTPELNGAPFTHTFIYGAYDGRLTFIEPMFTKSLLLTNPNITAPIKMPAAVQVSGYYPTKYFIRHNPVRKEYVIGLEEFVWLEAE